MEPQDRPPILGTPPEGVPTVDTDGRAGWSDGEGGIRFPPGHGHHRFAEKAWVDAPLTEPSPSLPGWHGGMMGHMPGPQIPYAGPPVQHWEVEAGKRQMAQLGLVGQPVAGGLSTASLVCGIVGSVMGLIPILAIFALASGLVGFVLGSIAYRKRSQAGTKKTMPMWGVALSGLAILLGIIGFVIVSNAIDDVRDSTDNLNETISQSERELECAQRAGNNLESVERCFNLHND